MQNFEDYFKIEEYYDSSKSALIIPLILSLTIFILKIIKISKKELTKNKFYKIVKKITKNSFEIFFVGIFGISIFSFFVFPSIIFYICFFFYVVFLKLDFLHKNDFFQKRVMNFVFLVFICFILIFFCFDIDFSQFKLLFFLLFQKLFCCLKIFIIDQIIYFTNRFIYI